MARMSMASLGSLFLRIGNITFGGGDPTIAALQRELVERRRVVSGEEHAVLYALARITPGTNMLAYCAGAGWVVRGWCGAVVAIGAVTIPSSLLGILLLDVYERLSSNPTAGVAVAALLAAAVGLMFAGAWLLVRPYLSRHSRERSVVIGCAAFLLAWADLLSPIQVLALAALAGYFWSEPE